MGIVNYLKIAIGIILSVSLYYIIWNYTSLQKFKEAVTVNRKVDAQVQEIFDAVNETNKIKVKGYFNEKFITDCESNCTHGL